MAVVWCALCTGRQIVALHRRACYDRAAVSTLAGWSSCICQTWSSGSRFMARLRGAVRQRVAILSERSPGGTSGPMQHFRLVSARAPTLLSADLTPSRPAGGIRAVCARVARSEQGGLLHQVPRRTTHIVRAGRRLRGYPRATLSLIIEIARSEEKWGRTVPALMSGALLWYVWNRIYH